MYESIVRILRESHGWKADEAPAPAAIADYLAAHPDAKAFAIAAQIDNWLWSAYAGQEPPYGWAGDAYTWARHRMFTKGQKYWYLNTALALEMQVEIPVPHAEKARTVEEWWDHQERNLNRLGYTLLDAGEAQDAERAARWRAAENVPAEWQFAGLGLVYQLLTREGLLKKWLAPGLTPPSEYLGGDIRRFYGLNAQQVLDNLLAQDAGKPPVWGK